MLVEAGVLPICGASLPGGPQTSDSRCQADGLQNGEDLHLDHEPPLTDAERLDARIVCDPLRIQLLCGVDHSRKTRLEQHGVMG